MEGGPDGPSARPVNGRRDGARGALPRLTDEAVALYRFAVANPHWTETEAAQSIGLDQSRLARAVHALRSSRLLRPSVDPGCTWEPVGPEAALVDLLAEEELKVHREQARIIKIRDELLSLQPAYRDALRGRDSGEVIDVIECVGSSLPMLLAEHARQVQGEVCVANPGHELESLQWLHAFGPVRWAPPSNLRVRLVVDDASRQDQLTRRHLSLLSEHGTEVRTTQGSAIWFVLFDRRTAVLPAHGYHPGTTGVAVVRYPAVVASLWAAFELLWDLARPMPVEGVAPRLRDRVRLDILKHLAAGHKDEVVARRLGLSVRTCRRYIAEIMEQLGATSRFQAGMLAERQVFLALTEGRPAARSGAGPGGGAGEVA